VGVLDRVSAMVARAMDAGVRWQLARLPIELPLPESWTPADPTAFWAASRLRDPAPITAGPVHHRRRGGVEVRTLTGPSQGPGGDPGSRQLVATAHLRPGRRDLPFVLVVHGLLAPGPWYEERRCRALVAGGAQAARIDLPLHLRRHAPGRRSGEGFIQADLSWTREIVRQSVEDCAAVLAWASREVSDRVEVCGTSLGGLIAVLLAAHLELDAVVALAPFCDPAATIIEHLPDRTRRALGLDGESGGVWGADRAAARLVVGAALAPVVARTFRHPVTPGERIAVVRPTLDGVVGDAPMAALAEAWGAELWSYPQGHVSVLNAPGLNARVNDWLVTPHAGISGTSGRGALAGNARTTWAAT
jgi:predicted alpha/beta-hydrolase family hydrolase